MGENQFMNIVERAVRDNANNTEDIVKELKDLNETLRRIAAALEYRNEQ